MVHLCTFCHLMPKDDFVWFLVEIAVTGVLGVSRLVPAFIALSVVTQAMVNTSLVWLPCSLAAALTLVWFSWRSRPAPGHGNDFLKAVIMANNVHQP